MVVREGYKEEWRVCKINIGMVVCLRSFCIVGLLFSCTFIVLGEPAGIKISITKSIIVKPDCSILKQINRENTIYVIQHGLNLGESIIQQ